MTSMSRECHMDDICHSELILAEGSRYGIFYFLGIMIFFDMEKVQRWPVFSKIRSSWWFKFGLWLAQTVPFCMKMSGLLVSDFWAAFEDLTIASKNLEISCTGTTINYSATNFWNRNPKRAMQFYISTIRWWSFRSELIFDEFSN